MKVTEKNTKYPPLTDDEKRRIEHRRRDADIARSRPAMSQAEQDRQVLQWAHDDIFGTSDHRP